MIVYGHHDYCLDVAPFLRTLVARLDSLPASPPHDAIVDLYVDLGEACSALTDAHCPDRDDEIDALRPWDAALHRIAQALTASFDGDDRESRRAVASCRRGVRRLRSGGAGVVRARPSEGFAQWAVDPGQYVVAARRFTADLRPGAVLCIGIRTIGLPLAHVVAAAIERDGIAAQICSLRPRGHPFDRRTMIADRLRRRIGAAAVTHYAIVDEGPGLSGSSFAAVSDALMEIGVSSNRIVLFSSWNPDPEVLSSVRGRRTWARHRRFVAAFEDVMATAAHRNLSAGAWRPLVFGADVRRWPAVHPQHERRKYFHAGVGRPSWISRFAGLGRYGTAKLQRAAVLADAGFTPQPVRMSRGMLTEEWIEAPTPPSDLRLRGGWIDRLAAYVAFLRRTFATGRRAQVDDLAAMIDQNMREAFGVKRAATDRLIRTARAFDEPEVAIDGRMLPHEWLIDAADRAIKTDALDHHADDFLPGSCDAAWDIAGAVVEFALDGSATARLIQRYRELSGDMTIAARLSFYRTAYLAYRTGYASLAADTLRGSADGVRFARLTARYRRLLAGPAPPRR